MWGVASAAVGTCCWLFVAVADFVRLIADVGKGCYIIICASLFASLTHLHIAGEVVSCNHNCLGNFAD